MNRDFFEAIKIYREATEELDRKLKEATKLREQVLAQGKRLRAELEEVKELKRKTLESYRKAEEYAELAKKAMDRVSPGEGKQG